jgi:hypothetical protein
MFRMSRLLQTRWMKQSLSSKSRRLKFVKARNWRKKCVLRLEKKSCWRTRRKMKWCLKFSLRFFRLFQRTQKLLCSLIWPLLQPQKKRESEKVPSQIQDAKRSKSSKSVVVADGVSLGHLDLMVAQLNKGTYLLIKSPSPDTAPRIDSLDRPHP